MALSSFNIKKQIQIASLYSAYKTSEYIEKEKKGGCVKDSDIDKLKAINALCGTIYRYGTIYKQPSITFSIDTPISNSVVTMVFGDVSFPLITTVSNVAAEVASQISDFINDENIGFTSVSNGKYITISAVNGSLSNQLAASMTASNGMVIGIPFPTEFSDDGSDYFSENTDRCITDTQIYGIIDKINIMIDEPYGKFLTF